MNLRSIVAALAVLCSLVAAGTAQGSAGAAAQVPLLAISAPAAMTIRGPDGKPVHFWQVRITNRYHAAATAYAVSYVTPLPFGFSSRGSRWFDAIPGVHLISPLAPGAQVPLTVPWHGGRVPSVKDRCVIYADGSVAGNLSLVGHFMSARAVFQAELPSTIARLQSIAQGSGGSRAEAVRYFERQSEVERRVLRTFDPKGRHPNPPARIALSVVATLTYSQQDMQAAAAVLARTMATWQAQLAASRPRLPQIAFSPGHRGS